MIKNKTPEYLNVATVEQQEDLTQSMLDSLFVPLTTISPNNRPKDSFLELMNWVESGFKHNLKDTTNLNKFIHNRIVIDGQFITFAKEQGVKITCLFKDSIISWKTENRFEKYFVQGIFKIEYKGCEFIHSALFHKGNQNEDEVSFFIMCSSKNYQSYLNLRNTFDEWVQQRDRSNLHIRVIDGEDIPYTKESTWEDLFLPDDLKSSLKDVVENFLASKDFYLKHKIPWKRGILLYGSPGNGKTSLIRTIISTYNFKPVTITASANDDTVKEAFSYAENQSPALLYFEDLDTLLDKLDLSAFLNLMDGIASRNGLFVIATANDIKKLKPSITDRPSRFDRKYKIPIPNQKMAYIYLKKWFGKLLPDSEYKKLSVYSEKYKFSYVHLKELYISSMYEALSNNRKSPTKADVNNALKCLIADKNILSANQLVDTTKYLKK